MLLLLNWQLFCKISKRIYWNYWNWNGFSSLALDTSLIDIAWSVKQKKIRLLVVSMSKNDSESGSYTNDEEDEDANVEEEDELSSEEEEPEQSSHQWTEKIRWSKWNFRNPTFLSEEVEIGYSICRIGWTHWYGSSSSVDGKERKRKEIEDEARKKKKKHKNKNKDQPKPVQPKKSQQQIMFNKYFGRFIPRMTFKEAIVRSIPYVIILALGSCILFLPKKWVAPIRPTPPPTTPRPRVTLPSWLKNPFG